MSFWINLLPSRSRWFFLIEINRIKKITFLYLFLATCIASYFAIFLFSSISDVVSPKIMLCYLFTIVIDFFLYLKYYKYSTINSQIDLNTIILMAIVHHHADTHVKKVHFYILLLTKFATWITFVSERPIVDWIQKRHW